MVSPIPNCMCKLKFVFDSNVLDLKNNDALDIHIRKIRIQNWKFGTGELMW